MTYITREEYLALTGETISPIDLFKYDSAFKGFLHPNNYMVEDFKVTNGVYPTEIKFAFIEFVHYVTNNASILDGIPINASTVGSTSVNYISAIANQIYKGNIKLPTTLTKGLKPTNVLSPLAYKRQTKFVGTPFVLADWITRDETTGEEVIEPMVSNYDRQLLDVTKLLEDLPSVDVTVWHRVDEIVDGILNPNYKYEVKHVVKGWFRLNDSDSNHSATIIIDANDINNTPVRLKQSGRVTFKYGTDDKIYTTERFDSQLDYNNEPHHYFIYGE